MATQPESGRTTEQIVYQFLSKALHAILAARIPQIHGPSTSAPPAGRQLYRKRDRWFHLALGDLPPALDDPSSFLPHGATEPLIIDVLLSPRDDPTLPEAIIERWVAQCEIPAPWSALHSPAENSSDSFLVKRTYKKSIILLRSIYSVLRLLPAYRIYKMFCSSNQSYNYDISYRISSFAEPFSRREESELRSHCFAPVETQFGQLVVSVQYRPSLSEFNLEISSLLPPMLINDYVGSPAADPMRAFPSSPSDRGLIRTATSAPLRSGREVRPSSAPASAPLFHRQHSMENPANRFIPQQQYPVHPHRKSGLHFDEFKGSPPFYMSPTPSPPTFSNSYMQSRLRGGTSPVSIPQSDVGKLHGFRSPAQSDPTRNFLPPQSPKSIRALDLSSQESPSDSRPFRKISDASSTLKGITDGRDDSGRFSGVHSSDSQRFAYSRSSSRLSITDDLDDPDFSYPFAVDDVDTSDSQTRSNERKEVFELSHKSQEAAVGALVHILKNAPSLCDSSYSSKSEYNEGGLGSSSSFILSRKTSDALDEFRSYKDMKEIVMSQNKTRMNA